MIQKATPTATLLVNNSPQTYNGSPQAATVVISVSSVPGAVANVKYDGSPTAPTNAGTYAVTATFTSADPSYASAAATSSLTINPATPTITVNGGPFNYDGTPQAATATAAGVDGVTPVAGTLSFTYNGSSTPPTAAGTYSVTATFTSADPDYANATATGSLTINPALTVSGSVRLDGQAAG